MADMAEFELQLCELLCQLPPNILHVSDPPDDHPARPTLWIQRETAEMFTSPSPLGLTDR